MGSRIETGLPTGYIDTNGSFTQSDDEPVFTVSPDRNSVSLRFGEKLFTYDIGSQKIYSGSRIVGEREILISDDEIKWLKKEISDKKLLSKRIDV